MTQSLDWQTESLRFTFLGCPDTAAELITWSAITGRDADSVTLKKALGSRNEEGRWAGGHLTVSAVQGRVDITINAAAIDVPVGPPQFPTMGSLSSVADQLLASLLNMRLPKSARLAVGAKLNMFASTPAESLVFLKRVVPFLNVDTSCIDVMYQQNKPKKMRPSGIQINRICKWAQMSMHFINFVPLEGQVVTPDSSSEVKHALQFDMDINTSLAGQLPHQDSYGKIVEGLFAELKHTLIEVN